MKKMKMTIAAAIFCAAAFAGYTAYDKATMTDQEKLLQANLEALTDTPESTSGKTMCAGIKNSCTPQVGNVYVGPSFIIP